MPESSIARLVRRRGPTLAAALLFATPFPSEGAQEASEASPPCASAPGAVQSLTGFGADRLRLAELLGEVPIRSRASQTAATLEEWRCPGVPDGVAPSPSLLRSVYNTSYPVERNNGPLWAGRGMNASLQAGVEASWGRFRAAVAPTVSAQQNREFETVMPPFAHLSQWVYPLWNPGFDWLQRFGDESFWEVTPGESYLRANVDWLAVSLSTENLWWGPTVRYPLLLSNTAAGFPHASLEMARPVWVGIGHVEGQILWGVLSESRFYNDDPEDDRRIFSGFTMSYQPAFFRGLHVGVSALLHQTIEDGRLQGGQLFDIFTNPLAVRGGNVAGNALGSLFFRWVHVESRFEVYGEWGREDHAWDLNDALSEPNHSQGWTLGLVNGTPLSGGWLKLSTEITNLHTTESGVVYRGVPRWYVHGDVKQGHTHRGQLLGSSVGPGSDAQFAAIDWFTGASRIGVFFERVRWDEDGYRVHHARAYGFHGHDVELTSGLRYGRRFGDFTVDGTAAGALRRNRNFLNLDGATWDFPWETNGHFELLLGWTSGGGRR